jgi:hypothetical protein
MLKRDIIDSKGFSLSLIGAGSLYSIIYSFKLSVSN